MRARGRSTQVDLRQLRVHVLPHQRHIRQPLQNFKIELRRPFRLSQETVPVGHLQLQRRGQPGSASARLSKLTARPVTFVRRVGA